MQMTHTLKALAAAVSMTFALGAQAAPINTDNVGNGLGSGTGAGSLVLAMFDRGNNRSAVFNTGLSATSFNTQAANSFNVAIAGTDLTNLNTFLGGVTNLGGFQWNIVAISHAVTDPEGDLGGPFWDEYGFQTTVKPGTVFSGPNTAHQGITVALGAAATWFSNQNSLPGNPLAAGNVAVTTNPASPSYFDQQYKTNIDGAGDFNNAGMLGESLPYFFHHGVGVNFNVVGQVASTKYPGEWKLDYSAGAGTSLSYNVAPIPVPAAVWMLGSGIAGLIATRRRKAA